jgi:hypothetical protein
MAALIHALAHIIGVARKQTLYFCDGAEKWNSHDYVGAFPGISAKGPACRNRRPKHETCSSSHPASGRPLLQTPLSFSRSPSALTRGYC